MKYDSDPKLEPFRQELFLSLGKLQPLIDELPEHLRVDVQNLGESVVFGKRKVFPPLHPVMQAMPEIAAAYQANQDANQLGLTEMDADRGILFLDRRLARSTVTYATDHLLSGLYQLKLVRPERVDLGGDRTFDQYVLKHLLSSDPVPAVLRASANPRIQLERDGFVRHLRVDGYYCVTAGSHFYSLPTVEQYEMYGDQLNTFYASMMSTLVLQAQRAGSFAALHEQFLRGTARYTNPNQAETDHPNFAIGLMKAGNLLAQKSGYGEGWAYLANAFQSGDPVAVVGYLDSIAGEMLQTDDQEARERLVDVVLRLTLRNYMHDETDPDPIRLSQSYMPRGGSIHDN